MAKLSNGHSTATTCTTRIEDQSIKRDLLWKRYHRQANSKIEKSKEEKVNVARPTMNFVGINLEPTPDDVLLKSGEVSRNNPGNVRFHERSRGFRGRLEALGDQKEKDALAEELAAAVHAWGGRFLAFDDATSQWYEIDKRRRQRKCLKELLNISRSASTQENDQIKPAEIETDYFRESEQNSNSLDSQHTPERKDNVEDAKQISNFADGTSGNLNVSLSQSLDLMLDPFNSKSQLFSSKDLVAKLLASQSGISAGLPPLEALENPDGSNKAQSAQEIDFASDTYKAAQTSENSTEETVVKKAEQQQRLIHELLESVSQGAQGAIPGHSQENTTTSTTTLSYPSAVEFFASRAWGTELGPVQNLDFHKVFDSWKKDAESTNQNSSDEMKNRKKTRDWNAIVMEGLEAGMSAPQISSTSSIKEQTHAVPADTLLQVVAVNSEVGGNYNGSNENDVRSQEDIQTQVKPSVIPLPTPTANSSVLAASTAAGQIDRTLERAEEKVSTPPSSPAARPVTREKELQRKPTSGKELQSPPTQQEISPTMKSGRKSQRLKTQLEKPKLRPIGNREEVFVSPPKRKRSTKTSGCEGAPCGSNCIAAPCVAASVRSVKKETQPPPETEFVEPKDVDVLLGRGGRTNNHPGNKRYLELKDQMQPVYLAADKNAKTPISQQLADAVHEWGGRFLKLDELQNQWFEVDGMTARKKCSQSLREINTPEERKAKRAKYGK